MQLFSGRVRWVLIFWMFVISAISYLDRVNISIAGGSIAKEFGLDNIQLGWVFSAFVLGYALFQAPGGRLAAKAAYVDADLLFCPVDLAAVREARRTWLFKRDERPEAIWRSLERIVRVPED